MTLKTTLEKTGGKFVCVGALFHISTPLTFQLLPRLRHFSLWLNSIIGNWFAMEVFDRFGTLSFGVWSFEHPGWISTPS